MCPPLTTINPYNVRFVSGHQHHICILLCRAQHFYLRRETLTLTQALELKQSSAASFAQAASDGVTRQITMGKFWVCAVAPPHT